MFHVLALCLLFMLSLITVSYQLLLLLPFYGGQVKDLLKVTSWGLGAMTKGHL